MADLKQCQGERRYGGVFSFGPPTWNRCTNKPRWIVTGPRLNDSCCEQCRPEVEEMCRKDGRKPKFTPILRPRKTSRRTR